MIDIPHQNGTFVVTDKPTVASIMFWMKFRSGAQPERPAVIPDCLSNRSLSPLAFQTLAFCPFLKYPSRSLQWDSSVLASWWPWVWPLRPGLITANPSCRRMPCDLLEHDMRCLWGTVTGHFTFASLSYRDALWPSVSLPRGLWWGSSVSTCHLFRV